MEKKQPERKISKFQQEELWHKVLGYTAGQRVSWRPTWGDERHRHYDCWIIEPAVVKGKILVRFGDNGPSVYVEERTLRVITYYKKREKK